MRWTLSDVVFEQNVHDGYDRGMSAGETAVRGLDLPALTAWFARELPQLPAPLTFERIGDGRSNLTFAVTAADGGRAVLRRPPLGPLLPKAHDMGREARVLGGFAQAGAPVPAPLASCPGSDVIGVPFYVMEKVEGTVVASVETAQRFDPAVRRRMGESLVDVLAQLHAVDVDAVGLGDLGRKEDYIARQLRRWVSQWEASRTGELPLVEELAERFGRNIPRQRDATIAHGDYRLGNVVVGDDGTVRGVLDWELCTLGEPLADLGYLLTFWAGAGADRRPHEDEYSTLEGFMSQSEIIERYGAASGRDVGEARYFHAFSIWKLALIIQGVRRRVAENPDNVRGTLEGLPEVQDLIVSADAVARDAGI